MREFSSNELDLMAQAYERACDWLARHSGLASDNIEKARMIIVEGIVEAMNKGERDEEILLNAGMSKVDMSRYLVIPT